LHIVSNKIVKKPLKAFTYYGVAGQNLRLQPTNDRVEKLAGSGNSVASWPHKTLLLASFRPLYMRDIMKHTSSKCLC
jgi:hypothetical protein